MNVRVEIVAGGEPPSQGSPVIVQVMDTEYQDVVAAVKAETRGKVGRPEADGVIAVAELNVPDPGGYPTVYVHIDVDRDGRVSNGDYITMQSYPCREGTVRVEVRRV